MLQIGWQGLHTLQVLRFCWPCLLTLSAHAHNLAQYVGKDRLLYRRTNAAAAL